MKLAVSSFAWPPERTPAVRSGLKNFLEVKGVELVLPMAFPDPARATRSEAVEVRDAWNEAGLSVVSVQSLVFGNPDLRLFGDEEVSMRLLDHLEHMGRLADWLGARVMVFGSPANRLRGDLPMDAAFHKAAVFFKQLGQRVSPLDVTVCIEPNPPIYAGCDFINTMAQAVQLVEMVDHPCVQVQCDTGAIIHEQRSGAMPSAGALENALQRSAHLHISNPGLLPLQYSDDEQASCAKQVLPHLNLSWASIEMRTPPGGEPLAAIERAVRSVCSWYPIES
ncbi:MAG: sugar phosphate isomerase/epimerase family protein [Flavobacteriales bacterium]